MKLLNRFVSSIHFSISDFSLNFWHFPISFALSLIPNNLSCFYEFYLSFSEFYFSVLIISNYFCQNKNVSIHTLKHLEMILYNVNRSLDVHPALNPWSMNTCSNRTVGKCIETNRMSKNYLSLLFSG